MRSEDDPREYIPCLSEFWEAWRFPCSVFGPRDLEPLRRAASGRRDETAPSIGTRVSELMVFFAFRLAGGGAEGRSGELWKSEVSGCGGVSYDFFGVL